MQRSYLLGLRVGRAVVFAAACAAASGSGAASKAGSDADVLYHNYCSVCHGDRGDGRSRARNSLVPPPRDFTQPDAIEQLTRERMLASVMDGRPGTAMVGWKTQLTKVQIEGVVDYIRDTFMKPRTDPALAQGRELYARHCGTCHGAGGEGSSDAKVPTFTSPRAASSMTRERMIAAVTDGRPGTSMKGFGRVLKASEIAVVVDYVRTAFMMPAIEGLSGTRAHTPRAAEPAQAAVDMRAAMPKGLKGDAARGEKFYRANCATCHGEKGDGQGPRAYFIRPRPRNFLQPPAIDLYNRPYLFAAISLGKLGTEMPAWSKVLSDQEIANVAEYVYGAFIRPGIPVAKGK